MVEVHTYEEAKSWLSDGTGKQHLLLGNGFSVAYDHNIFSYKALRDHAEAQGLIHALALKFFTSLNTYDFELVIRQLLEAANALMVIDTERHSDEIAQLRAAADALKEGLAQTLAGLHPERPTDITDAAYSRVQDFLAGYADTYTANYDLLLYWSTMHTNDGEARVLDSDDGFRAPAHEAPYVVWDYLKPQQQSVHYLHGALHLYRDASSAELQKLTWVRTGEALIDQIRGQLAANRYPLIVAEGTSSEKLAKIQTSDYLSRTLRSLASIGGNLTCYGLSFSANDAHISAAIARGNVRRLAVSLYGNADSDQNQATVEAALQLIAARHIKNARYALEVKFYSAESTPLWD